LRRHNAKTRSCDDACNAQKRSSTSQKTRRLDGAGAAADPAADRIGTMYRIRAENSEVRQRRRQLRHCRVEWLEASDRPDQLLQLAMVSVEQRAWTFRADMTE
jgi:hypothetical protein